MTSTIIEAIQDIKAKLESAERDKHSNLKMMEQKTDHIEAIMYKLKNNVISDTPEDEELKRLNRDLLYYSKVVEKKNDLIDYYKFKLEQLKNQ